MSAWLEENDLEFSDVRALVSTAALIGVRTELRDKWSEDSLELVAGYLDTQYANLVAEVRRLEAIRLALKVADPYGVSILLERIDVENISELDTAISDIPPELVSVIEKVGEREVEILFPLTHLTPLQRNAIGVGNAQSVLLRLMIGGDGMPPGFCLHLDTESNKSENDTSYFSAHQNSVGIHAPWMAFTDQSHPCKPICHGRDILIKYQLARRLHTHLINGFDSLTAVHTLVTNTLSTLGKHCIGCCTAHEIKLRRPTICQSPTCVLTLQKATLDILLSHIRTDPLAIDFLITTVFAAAQTSNLLLLPNCPLPTTALVLQTIALCPSITTLSKARSLQTTISALGTNVVKLLTWICLSHRSYLASATGLLKIPSLPPGTQQFILANASPEKEASFLSHTKKDPTTRLLFHGTTPDRLFSILHRGLQIKSNTTLQAHSAASGAGIYMAEDPRTSWGYCGSGLRESWGESRIKGFKVLLGCENAGVSVGDSRMHVVRDESSVMVRYLFLVPVKTAGLPVNIKTHVDTAVLAAMRGLRGGAY